MAPVGEAHEIARIDSPAVDLQPGATAEEVRAYAVEALQRLRADLDSGKDDVLEDWDNGITRGECYVSLVPPDSQVECNLQCSVEEDPATMQLSILDDYSLIYMGGGEMIKIPLAGDAAEIAGKALAIAITQFQFD